MGPRPPVRRHDAGCRPGQLAVVDIANGLVRTEPDLAGDILWSTRALAQLDARWTAHILDAWNTGRTPYVLRSPRDGPARLILLRLLGSLGAHRTILCVPSQMDGCAICRSDTKRWSHGVPQSRFRLGRQAETGHARGKVRPDTGVMNAPLTPIVPTGCGVPVIYSQGPTSLITPCWS